MNFRVPERIAFRPLPDLLSEPRGDEFSTCWTDGADGELRCGGELFCRLRLVGERHADAFPGVPMAGGLLPFPRFLVAEPDVLTVAEFDHLPRRGLLVSAVAFE